MTEKQAEITCPICEETKNREEFYASCGYCKPCHKQYMSDLAVNTRRNFIHEYIAKGKIKLEDFRAAERLLISCQSRFKACKYNEKGYEEIECNYASPFEFFLKLLDKDSFFEGWIDLMTCHIANGEDRNSLPVIDRINEKGHYTLDNVQPLTHYDNTKKARQKHCTAVLFKDGNLVDTFKFDSKKQCNELLQTYVPVKLLKTLQYDTPFFQSLGNGYYLKVQTDDAKLEDILNKDNHENYKIVFKDLMHYVYDFDTNKVQVYKDDGSYTFKIRAIAFQ